VIVVNSNYTLNIFKEHFPTISQGKKEETKNPRKHCPEILYPAINMKTFIKSKNFEMTMHELLDQKYRPG